MKKRIYDMGYITRTGFRYKIQKRIFGIWFTIAQSDYEDVALREFHEIKAPKIIKEETL